MLYGSGSGDKIKVRNLFPRIIDGKIMLKLSTEVSNGSWKLIDIGKVCTCLYLSLLIINKLLVMKVI